MPKGGQQDSVLSKHRARRENREYTTPKLKVKLERLTNTVTSEPASDVDQRRYIL